MSKLVGKGSRQGSTWSDRAGDIIQQPAVWAGLAGALAVAGPRGRRAALRASVCYAAAALIQILIKPLIGRSRPSRSGRMRPGPVTSSFPSGHAASDLAFALGAAQEIPLLFLPMSGATLAVHWSLVRSRGHYASDVVAGGVLGIAVALAAWKFWPPGDRPVDDEDRSRPVSSDNQEDQGLGSSPARPR